MPIDTVNDLPPRVQYNAAAAQTVFAYPFPIFADGDLVVDVDGATQALDTDYTVSGEGEDAGGNVTFLSAMAGAEIVTIYRDLAIERTSDFQTNGPLSSATFNDELDRITLVQQQLNDGINRSLRLPVITTGNSTDTELTADNWAGMYMSFDADGIPSPAAISSATMTQATIGLLLHPRTAAEIAASVTPTSYAYPFGDVRRYGATGDGATNDATAFANALLACSGEAIVLQPGFTYKVNSALTVGANTTIFGYGASLDFSAAGNITCLTLGSGVKLYGFTITGPGNGSYAAGSIGVSCSGTDNTPSAPTYVTGPEIIDVTITEFGNYGVFLKYINHGTIRGCKITEIGYAGIGGLSCNRLNVEGNYIGQITPGSSSNCYGVFIDRSEGTLTADPYSNFCRIVGNTIEDIPIWEAIDTHAGQNFVIADNIISNCKRGIAVTDSDVSNVPTYGPVNVVISGNCISGLSTGSAILVNGAYTGGSTVDYAENISIIANTITSGGLAGDDTEGCIKVRSTKNLVISGNTLRQPIAAGISLYFDNLSCNINGNVIVDPNDATDDSSCIAVGGINNKGTISGNTFVCENTGLATKVAERAVYAASAYAGMDLRIGDNARIGAAAARLVMSNFARAYTAADTTPSVANTDFLVISNAGAVTITAFDDGYEGQLLTLWFADSNTTVDRTSCYLSGGVNFVGTVSDTLTLKKYQSGWYEVARGVNS